MKQSQFNKKSTKANIKYETRQSVFKSGKDKVTVKFVDDGIEYTCNKNRLIDYTDETPFCKVLWKDGKWYEAKIISDIPKDTIKTTTIQSDKSIKNALNSDIYKSKKNESQAKIFDEVLNNTNSFHSELIGHNENKQFENLSITTISDNENKESNSSSSQNDFMSDSEESIVLEQINSNNTQSVDTVSANDNSVTAISVKKCKSTKEKRNYDKIHYCVYCKIPQTKLSRHLKRKHSDEDLVREAYNFPAKSKERRNKLEIIRAKGDYIYNNNVLQTGRGELITWKSLSTNKEVSDYLACRNCFAMFLRKDLWKHDKKCRAKLPDTVSIKRIQTASSMMLNTPENISDKLRTNILVKMNFDNITLAIKNDKLILLFAEKLYHRLGYDNTQHQYISQKIRELGRLLVTLRSINSEIQSLWDAIHPSHFKDILKAVQNVSGYNEKIGKYKTPSLALKLGHSLKKCAFIAKGEYIINSEIKAIEETEQFISLMEMNWSSEISSSALRTLYNAKWNKSTLLPLTEDIVKLQKCLKITILENENKLKTDQSNIIWLKLCKAVLASIILFNKRRGSEVSKMLLSTYQNFQPTTFINEEVKQSLSKLETLLLSNFIRIEIQGKRGRKVPVLFTNEMKKVIDLLVETRDNVGVNKENKFLFARPNFNSLTYLRGHDCLREFATESGGNANTLTSTKLRKHIATISQLLNLKENELDILASFLGHDIRIHRKFYRLPEDTLQIAKIGKLLMCIETGTIHKYKGKSLDDVEINENDKIEIDDDKIEIDGDNQYIYIKKLMKC